MKLGIALCTYNGEKYLAAQLESILAQTRRPDYLLACDDVSTDRSVGILESFANSASFPVRVLRNRKNLGYLRNFEQAIAACEADVIVLCDQDDYWMPAKLQRIESALQVDSGAGGVFSDAEIVDADLKPLGITLLDTLRVSAGERTSAAAGSLLPVLLRRNIVAGATLAIQASWKDTILPIPDRVVHDEWITLVMAAYGALRFIPESLIRYRQHGSNQLGAPSLFLHRRISSLTHSRRNENTRVLQFMRNLLQRLAAGKRRGLRPDAIAEVEGKVAHLERRVALPEGRINRIPAVVSELAKGGYTHYSSGWRTAVRDLVSPM